jgi:ketosteroid isomerase-like protein
MENTIAPHRTGTDRRVPDSSHEVQTMHESDVPTKWFREAYVLFPALVMLGGPWVGDRDSSPELESMIETERRFAGTCAVIGIRQSFVEFFADDGISFEPGPVVFKEAVKKRPQNPDAKKYTLQWEPQAGDIAQSGDMGYSTGPSLLSENPGMKPIRYGVFFSVWKKQKDGSWKVAVDLGVECPPADVRLGLPFVHQWFEGPDNRRGIYEKDHAELLAAESRFTETASSLGVHAAYENAAADIIRLCRDREPPLLGLDAIRQRFAGKMLKAEWSVSGSDVSTAGEFGYSYGRYEFADVTEKGYFVRVWKRDMTDAWRLVADVMSVNFPGNQE